MTFRTGELCLAFEILSHLILLILVQHFMYACTCYFFVICYLRVSVTLPVESYTQKSDEKQNWSEPNLCHRRTEQRICCCWKQQSRNRGFLCEGSFSETRTKFWSTTKISVYYGQAESVSNKFFKKIVLQSKLETTYKTWSQDKITGVIYSKRIQKCCKEAVFP